MPLSDEVRRITDQIMQDITERTRQMINASIKSLIGASFLGGKLKWSAVLAPTIITVTADATLSAADANTDDWIIADATSAALTLTFPPVNARARPYLIIKKDGVHNVTFAPDPTLGTDTFNGAASFTLSAQYSWAVVKPDTDNGAWYVQAAPSGLPAGSLGDLLVYTDSGWGLLPPGTDDYVLTMVDGVPAWARACCDAGDWEIALIAGGTTDGSIDGSVDGTLGTNTLYGPLGMAVYLDGTLYFIDGYGTFPGIRTLDLSTGDVEDLSPDSFFNTFISGESPGLAIDSAGDEIWYSGAIGGDSTAIGLFGMGAPGGSFDGSVGGSSSLSPDIPLPTPVLASGLAFPTPNQLAVSPDNARVYFTDGPNGGSTVYYYKISDKTVYTLADTTITGVQGCGVDPDGNVYVLSPASGAVTKISADGLTITALSDNAPGTGYSGDGGLANTGGTTPQFNTPASVAYDSVSDTIAIVDAGNFVIRAIDNAGNLSTIAGISGTALGSFPVATPAAALTKNLGARLNQIIPAPGGGFYISVGNNQDAGDSIDDGIWAIYKLTQS